MQYFGVLARFVVVPLLILRFLLWRDRQKGVGMSEELSSWDENAVLAGHVVTAVTYTTLWDNYLVAKGVWNYDPDLVTGHTIGYVPIEEYTFFVLQTLLTGSFMQAAAHRIPADESADHPALTPQSTLRARLAVTGSLGVLWLASAYSLWRKETRDNYLGLILVWALPPIMLQTAFGGDILWRHRKLVATSILIPTAYLGVVDSLAIGSGTWHINPDHTIRWEVIRNLPFEELLFFFLTNVLLVFGVTLVQSKESEKRLPAFLQAPYHQFKQRLSNREQSKL